MGWEERDGMGWGAGCAGLSSDRRMMDDRCARLGGI